MPPRERIHDSECKELGGQPFGERIGSTAEHAWHHRLEPGDAPFWRGRGQDLVVFGGNRRCQPPGERRLPSWTPPDQAKARGSFSRGPARVRVHHGYGGVGLRLLQLRRGIADDHTELSDVRRLLRGTWQRLVDVGLGGDEPNLGQAPSH